MSPPRREFGPHPAGTLGAGTGSYSGNSTMYYENYHRTGRMIFNHPRGRSEVADT